MLDKEDKDFSGVLSTAKTALTLYSDLLVSRATSASDFTIQERVGYGFVLPVEVVPNVPRKSRRGSIKRFGQLVYYAIG